jgi:NADH-quinone oxidoreductase subunit H
MPLGGVVAYMSLLGMLGKKPFETFIAPAELASGPMVEYGGKQLGMLFFMHEITVFIEVSLFVNLFLGGGPTLLAFLLKYAVVYIACSLTSQLYGRFKIDQVFTFFYRVPIALAIIQALLVLSKGWGA